MSSRGSVTKNGHVTTDEYVYVYDDKGRQVTIYGAKVLEGKNGNHSLPDFAHTPGSIYIKLDSMENFRELRAYDDKGFPVIEIGYHQERKLSGNNDKVLHYHTFDADLTRHMGGIISPDSNPTIYYRYKKYLEAFGL